MPIQEYGTVTTKYGAARIIAAIKSGSMYPVVEAAVGDGNGAYYVPTRDQTALLNEVWRGPIVAADIDDDNSDMINVRFILPSDVSGFTVREAALFDADGGMLAVCNLPETKKTSYSSGVSEKLRVLMRIVVTDAGVLEFSIHPELDAVSLEQLNAKFADANAYTDTKTIAANAYTDTKTAAANAYTDTKAAAAKTYTDQKSAAAIAYTDQMVATAIAGDELGIFNYGRTVSSTAMPTSGVNVGATLWDFSSTRSYTYSGSSWAVSSYQPTLIQNSRVVILSFLDGTDMSGSAMAGHKGAAIVVGNDWQYALDAGDQSVPDGSTIIQRTSDAKFEARGDTGTLTSDTTAFANNENETSLSAFKRIKQKINGLISGMPKKTSLTPLANGTATIGNDSGFAAGNHIHPSDTTRAPLTSPALTGSPTAPTAVAGTNTTQIATTAFVQRELSNAIKFPSRIFPGCLMARKRSVKNMNFTIPDSAANAYTSPVLRIDTNAEGLKYEGFRNDIYIDLDMYVVNFGSSELCNGIFIYNKSGTTPDFPVGYLTFSEIYGSLQNGTPIFTKLEPAILAYPTATNRAVVRPLTSLSGSGTWHYYEHSGCFEVASRVYDTIGAIAVSYNFLVDDTRSQCYLDYDLYCGSFA